MSNLDVYGGSGRGLSRQTSRALNQLEDQSVVHLAAVRSQVNLQLAKVDGVAAVGQRALSATALTSQVEQSLAQIVPIAASRLQAVADLTTLTIADVVTDTASRLRQL